MRHEIVIRVVDVFGNEAIGCDQGSRGQVLLVFMSGIRFLCLGNRNQLELA